MDKKLLLAFQVFLLIQFAISDGDLCTSQFEGEKSSLCSQLSSDDQFCFFIDNECKNWYKECSDYNPGSNFDENVCTRIQPSSNKLKKCKVETAADGKKSCVQTDKACSDFTDKTCLDLDLGEDKRCVFINEKCEEHSYSCSGLEKSKCSQNIPSSNAQKCIWKDDNTGCGEEPRKCADYIVYSEKTKNNLECKNHQITTGTKDRLCVLYEDKCLELYESCQKAETEEACINNLPLTKDNNDENIIYYLTKCVWDGGCKAQARLCSDYKKIVNSYVPIYCSLYKSEKEHTTCLMNEEKDKCEEVADSCENYNLMVAEKDRTEEGCKSSLCGAGKKCVLENKQCKEVKLECGDFTSKYECLNYDPGKEGKKCIFKNNLCVEEYKDCQAYNDLVSEADRKKADCESIYSFMDNYKTYKCVFSDSKLCEREQVRKCSDYTGSDAEECQSYPTEYNYQACVYTDNKCVEKTNFVYSFCEDYYGEDKSICESIQPRVSGTRTIDKNSRCVFGGEEGYFSCKKQPKQCSDAKDVIECSSTELSNNKKRCVYIEKNCVEQYKTCEDYEASENVLDKATCESIIIADDNLSKCVFTAGASGAKGTCRKTRKSCSDFNIGHIYDKCLALDSNHDYNDTTQCTFSNNICKTELKSCFGLYYSGDANEEICKNAKTSNPNVKCVFQQENKYTKRCLEVNNVEAQIKYAEKEDVEETDSIEKTDKKEEAEKNGDNDDGNDNSNNAREKYLNKILLILFGALL